MFMKWEYKNTILSAMLWLGLWILGCIVILMATNIPFGRPFQMNGKQHVFEGVSEIEEIILVISDKTGFCHIDRVVPQNSNNSYSLYYCSGLTDKKIASIQYLITFVYLVCIYLVTLLSFLICNKFTGVIQCKAKGKNRKRYFKKNVLSVSSILIILLTSVFLLQNKKYNSFFSFAHLYVVRHKNYDWRCHTSFSVMNIVCSRITNHSSDTTGISNQIKRRPFLSFGEVDQKAYMGILVGLDTVPLAIAGFVHFLFFFSYKQRKGYCACGYNLKGNISGTCPECGNQVSSDDKQMS